MAQPAPELLVDGLHFPEGPRWRTGGDSGTGTLWFSDILACKVMKVDRAGHLETVVDVPEMASGLGWSADGTLHVVSVGDGKLMAVREGGTLVPAADMHALVGLMCNDMVMDGKGRAYIGSVGTGVDESKPPGPGNMPHFSHLLLVEPGGEARIVADRMTTPNGCVVTADGGTLIVAESFGFRLSAFDIREDGGLENRRVWADLGVPPDGICLDEEGCLWVAVAYYEHGGSGGYIRVEEGGRVLERIDVADYSAYACTLGGTDMRTLFLCESAVLGRERHAGDGRIRTVQVDVPGTSSP